MKVPTSTDREPVAHGVGRVVPVSKVKVPTSSDRDLLRIAAFIIFDAVVFHEALSGVVPLVRPVRSAKEPYRDFYEREWERIIRDIDYEPVFGIALGVLRSLPSAPNTENVLREITSAALSAVSSGILLKHDFMGRVYHKLLLRTTGHYYATYYTSIPAAWLLAGLVFRSQHATWRFSSVRRISQFRLVDPACGSGTLLSATYMAIKDRYILSQPSPMQLQLLHKVLVERVIHGWDVLDYAAHLTLTTLALHFSKGRVHRSNIYTVPCGVSPDKLHVHLGSLDYLDPQQTFVGRGFAQSAMLKGLDASREEPIARARYDAVVMNPPFSRSAKPNVKFGYSGDDAKARMNLRLGQVTKEIGASGIGQAGLGAYFMLLALGLAKKDGRIGVVIPRAALSGVSWALVREQYGSQCQIDFVVSNYDPGDAVQGVDPWSWSENTDLGEVLVVATRTRAPLEAREVTYINLWNKPRNEVEALLVSQQAIRLARRLRGNLQGNYWSELELRGKAIGCVYRVEQRALSRNWLAPCAFANPQVNAFVLRLLGGALPFVDFGGIVRSLGVDIKQVKDHFSRSKSQTAYRMVWGHQAAMNTMVLDHRFLGFGGPRRGARSDELFKKGSASLLVAERPHLSTECILAAQVETPALATAFWEVRPEKADWTPCLLLWFNSTYGFLTLLAASTSSMGDIFKAKKEQLRTLPVADPSRVQVDACRRLLDLLGRMPFRPFAQEFELASRSQGSRARIDEFFAGTLGLPAITSDMYQLLSRDPVITKRRL